MTTHKLITCILPMGEALNVARSLKDEKDIFATTVNNARGVGRLMGMAHRRLGDETERQVLAVMVPQDRADEIFEFLYRTARIDRPHGGLMYMQSLARANPLIVPELPEPA